MKFPRSSTWAKKRSLGENLLYKLFCFVGQKGENKKDTQGKVIKRIITQDKSRVGFRAFSSAALIEAKYNSAAAAMGNLG